jgi:hypothetical protein
MILTITQTHDEIFKGVKQESSLLAERRTDQQGTPTFDELVFDEEYLILFRDLFFDGRSNVESACSAYFRELDSNYFESNNMEAEKDFTVQLEIKDFLQQMANNVSMKMKYYLVAYVMYRWLETKLPQEAATYYARAETHLQDMKRYMEMRTMRRKIKQNWL